MSSQDPIETAWRIHGAVADWTGKVDTKATFALTIESAVLVGIVALSGDGHRLSGLHGFGSQFVYWFGISLLVVGVLCAVKAVAPGLRHKKLPVEQRDNFIYFGHLKSWDPSRLETALKDKDILPVLSRQLVVMSKIAWHKHQMVLASLVSSVAGTAVVALAAAIS